MREFNLLFIFMFCHCILSAQIRDTVFIPEVKITSYFSKRPLLRAPASVGVVDSVQLSKHHGQSLVPVMNTIPGVRMEERSPGSYRLSIRGSLIRSPFGVRNVKVYLDEFPLTDAGGNTYINLLDPAVIQRIEILKGPDGSLFGANSGGVVRFGIMNNSAPKIQTGFATGSFGLFRAYIQAKIHLGKHKITIADSWHRSSGYRANSELRRAYFHIGDEWNYADGFYLRSFAMISNLTYRTPGALTLDQFTEDPKSARPPTASLPGAEEQKAGVFNQTIYGGVMHSARFGKVLQHHLAVFGSHTEFENPYITNYEKRDERNLGLRTWMQTLHPMDSVFRWNALIGFEGQQTNSEISNSVNNKGEIGTLLVADNLTALNYFVFAQLTADIRMRLMLEAAVSLNYAAYIYEAVFPTPLLPSRRNFAPQWMPKISAAWAFAENKTVRASVAKGFSPPTLAELRSSDNRINTTLEPEDGWNYETGIRIQDSQGILWWDLSVFYYRQENSIVRRTNEAGEEYFVNNGTTVQPGLESFLMLHFFHAKYHEVIRDIVLTSSYTYSRFSFQSYTNDTSDYSGKNIAGMPDHIVVTSLSFDMMLGFSAFVQYTSVSPIPLNDANNVNSKPYHLLQAKIGWNYTGKSITLNLFAGADNLLDEQYSLGHDLNAFGRRYYNPAPGKNYYAGMNVTF